MPVFPLAYSADQFISMPTNQPAKAHVARSQLGTALQLYLQDLDPVSVHVLACGGLEVAEGLAHQADAKPFGAFALEVHPDMSRGELVKVRNSAWNAMKHAKDRNGNDRNDEELLAGPWKEDNEPLLMEGWFNLGQAGIPLPIEAQVFDLWMLAQHAAADQIDEAIDELFPGIKTQSKADRRAALIEAIAMARSSEEVMSSPLTDKRPLILPL